MSSGRTTVTIYLVVFCGLILVALILFAPRPLWLGFLLVVLLTAGGLGLMKGRHRWEEPYAHPAPQPPVMPVEHRAHRLAAVALPSNWEDYDFVFSATVRWLPSDARVDESHVNLEAMAVNAILERARKITKERPPGRTSLVQHELSGALGRMEPDGTGCLRAMAESVTLTLSEEDRNRLARLMSARKDNTLWEHERRYEQRRREYLSEHVLKDTGSAVVWWLAKNDDQVEKTVKDIGLLAQLSSAANNTHVTEPFRHLVPGPDIEAGEFISAADISRGESASESRTPADHFDGFLTTMGLGAGNSQRTLLARHVVDVLRKHGREDVADELVRRFDPDSSGPSLFEDFDPASAPPDDDEPDR